MAGEVFVYHLVEPIEARSISFEIAVQALNDCRSHLANATELQLSASCRAPKLEGNGTSTTLDCCAREALDPLFICLAKSSGSGQAMTKAVAAGTALAAVPTRTRALARIATVGCFLALGGTSSSGKARRIRRVVLDDAPSEVIDFFWERFDGAPRQIGSP